MSLERLDMVVAARSSGWLITWENGTLEYRETLPPLEVFPGANDEREKKTTVSTTDLQRQDFWKAIERIDPWNWTGDYSWTERVQMLGGQHWKLKLQQGGRTTFCEGNNTPDTVPPAFEAFLAALAALAGNEIEGPARLLKFLQKESQAATSAGEPASAKAAAETVVDPKPSTGSSIVGLAAPLVGGLAGGALGMLVGQHPHLFGPVYCAWAGGVGGAIGAGLDASASNWLPDKNGRIDLSTAFGVGIFYAVLAGALGGVVGGALDGGPMDLFTGLLMGLFYGLMIGLAVGIVGSVLKPLFRFLGPGRAVGLASGISAAVAAANNYATHRDDLTAYAYLGLAGGLGAVFGGAIFAYAHRRAAGSSESLGNRRPSARVPLVAAVLVTVAMAGFLLTRTLLVALVRTTGQSEAAALAANGDSLLDSRDMSAESKGAARRIVLPSGQVAAKLGGDYTVINDMAYSPDGKTAVGGAQSCSAFLWSLDNGRVLASQKVSVETTMIRGSEVFGGGPCELPISKVAFLPDGQRVLLAAGDDGNLQGHLAVWDLSSNKLVTQLHAHKDKITALSISADGAHALTASTDKHLTLWKIEVAGDVSISSEKSAEMPAEPLAASLSPDGRMAAVTWDWTGADREVIHLWDMSSGLEVKKLRGHAQDVTAVVFLPNGQLLSGSKDRTVRLWNCDTGQELRRFHVRGEVHSLAIDRDGRRALVAPERGALRLIALP